MSAAEVLPEVVCTAAKTLKRPAEGLGHMNQKRAAANEAECAAFCPNMLLQTKTLHVPRTVKKPRLAPCVCREAFLAHFLHSCK